MNLNELHILLADDDTDDCLFFEEAIAGLIPSGNFTAVHDGEQLMHLLSTATRLPHILFLDLNMPRKNGFECLTELKQHQLLSTIPVIIFSTSYEQEVVNTLYDNGAQYFIRKPTEFALFKNIVLHTLQLLVQKNILHPSREQFVLTIESNLVN